MGNAHVYQNHVEPLKTQLQRTPRPFPVLKIRPDVKDRASDGGFEQIISDMYRVCKYTVW